MKQHITKEQLNELNEKQREKLLEWYDNLEGDEKCISCGIYLTNQPPLLSISQMIEFLDEREYRKIWDMQRKDHNGMDHYWMVGVNEGLYNKDELCDALWEAVKSVL